MLNNNNTTNFLYTVLCTGLYIYIYIYMYIELYNIYTSYVCMYVLINSAAFILMVSVYNNKVLVSHIK